MTYEGIAKGKVIEFTEPLPYNGEAVRVSVEPIRNRTAPGSAESLLSAIAQSPRLDSQDVDELEREIERGTLPVRTDGLFNASK
jgi:hypothetical protein